MRPTLPCSALACEACVAVFTDPRRPFASAGRSVLVEAARRERDREGDIEREGDIQREGEREKERERLRERERFNTPLLNHFLTFSHAYTNITHSLHTHIKILLSLSHFKHFKHISFTHTPKQETKT